jgi:lipopolysaccharide transport system permease protein
MSNATAVTVRIAPGALSRISLRECWAFRDLLYFLVWRDVRVRYRQTLLGASWAVLQPLFSVVVFTVFFGRVAKITTDGVPYPVFSLAAVVPWTYFASAVAAGSIALVAQQQLISKVYFPRLLVPLAAVVTPLIDFAIAFALLVMVMIGYGVTPGPAVAWLPAFTLLGIATALAASLWFCALHVRFRDVRYVTPVLLQLWVFASPVVYPAALVPAEWRALYALNPMVGVIEGYRWALVGGPAPGVMILPSVGVVVIALVFGLMFFRRVEGTVVDHL